MYSLSGHFYAFGLHHAGTERGGVVRGVVVTSVYNVRSQRNHGGVGRSRQCRLELYQKSPIKQLIASRAIWVPFAGENQTFNPELIPFSTMLPSPGHEATATLQKSTLHPSPHLHEYPIHRSQHHPPFHPPFHLKKSKKSPSPSPSQSQPTHFSLQSFIRYPSSPSLYLLYHPSTPDITNYVAIARFPDTRRGGV